MDENSSPYGVNNCNASYDVVFDDSKDSLGKSLDQSNKLMRKLSLADDEFLSEDNLSLVNSSKENISFDDYKDHDELELLKSILEHNESPVVIVEKPQNQNKIDKIKSLLGGDFERRTCYIECLEIFHFNHLFGSILNKLLRPEVDLNEQIEFQSDIAECMDLNNYQNFIDKIYSSLKKIKCKDPIIVLDNADRLAKTNIDYVQFLIKINSIIPEIKFTTVLVSNLKLDHFKKLGLKFGQIYRIEFSPYSLDQIKSLIISTMPNKFSHSYGSYKSFVNQVVDMFASCSKDLNKLQNICEKFYAKYQSESNENEKTNLMVHQITFLNKNHPEILPNLIYSTSNELDMTCEVTYCGKYLLIAAFIASYNSVASDTKFLSKNQGAEKARKKRKVDLAVEQVFGPKSFTFERLYNIYKSLQQLNSPDYDGNDPMKTKSPTNLIFEQFRTFISFKLIIISEAIGTHSMYSGSAKYCISEFVTNEFINHLAKSVGFNLENHLEKNIF